jgi:iron complex outermembrane receptor protein
MLPSFAVGRTCVIAAFAVSEDTVQGRRMRLMAFAGYALAFASVAFRAAAQDVPSSVNTLKRLSVEELMNIDVTSVSRRPEPLSKAASAIQVITQEDIRRSGATSLPEALRLATNLEVAQIDSRQWAISARGFNSTTANKMLVLIDGRTIYTPLYAGVFWDVQDVLLEDIDRIEVISGPGGTLWGANAVNGVISIETKRTEATQGPLITAAGGSESRDTGGLRYGGALGNSLHYRAYGKYSQRGQSILPDGTDVFDRWHMVQGGFRVDGEMSADRELHEPGWRSSHRRKVTARPYAQCL